MGDINYEVTTVLERANFPLKDNRIPPTGFTTGYYTYDTVPIIGEAYADTDFNKDNGNEGTGADILHFHIPTGGNTGLLNITANIFYQTVNPKWLNEMFAHSSDEIDLFKDYYNAADKTPVFVNQVETTSNYTEISNNHSLQVTTYPNPTTGKVYINSEEDIQMLTVFTSAGKQVKKFNISGLGSQQIILDLPNQKGLYFIVIQSVNSKQVEKIIVK